MTREEYREGYLRSEHWLEVRKGALQRAEHRCQVCNGTKHLDVHHRTYERLGEERDSDLTVLCRGCHDLFHRTKKTRKAKKKLTKKAKREAISRKAQSLTMSPVYVSPSEKERYDKMREAERERRRGAKAERDRNRREVEQRRRENARTRDWRDERELPRKAA